MKSSYLCIWSSPHLFLFLRLNTEHSISPAALVLQFLYINIHTSIIYTFSCLLSYWLNFSLLAFTLGIYLVSFRHNLANFFSILVGTRSKNFLLISHSFMPAFHSSAAYVSVMHDSCSCF